MKQKKIRNPLMKRIPKELLGDWKKYCVVGLFLILMIGFVSGMYIANDSMQKTLTEGYTTYLLEDGHFTVDQMLTAETIASIETGQKADIRQYYIDQAKEELDASFESKFVEQFDSEFASAFETAYRDEIRNTLSSMIKDEVLLENTVETYLEQAKETGTYDTAYQTAYENAYEEAYEDAYEEAWNEILAEIDEAYEKAVDTYEINDENFEIVPVTVYENFYRNEEEDHDRDGISDGTIRIYVETNEVNLASVLEGRLPETSSEIAIDRMHADNVGIQVGDEIEAGGQIYEITGLISYVNYATLHENNTDFMFDAITFDVAMVTQEGFDRLETKVYYNYAWFYEDEPVDEIEEKSLSDDFMKALVTQLVVSDVEMSDYVPLYNNSAVWFAPEDMGSDKAMGGVLLDVLIVIIAFIFAITITNTITKESSTIGTLRAMGYTQKELVLHYISMPVIVTLVAALIGNILGYTVFTKVVTSMYYNSYSLPAYHQVFNGEALIQTTLIPVALMLIINFVIIHLMMKHTPLQFLHHDLKRNKHEKTVRLPKWKFLSRFRMRIILQNIPHYLTLLVGILFIAILLAMAVGMPATLNHYINHVEDLVFSNYQYVLLSSTDGDDQVITTENESAEPYDLYSLVRRGGAIDEEITIYGISENSQYVEIDDLDSLTENQVYISDSYSDKYSVSIGDEIVLDEKYENSQYVFEVVGIYDQSQNLSVFMSMESFAQAFDLEENEFSGYLSDTEITDIDEDQIAMIITVEDFTKMAKQLDHSMGAYMHYFQYLCIGIAAILIYLLTKIIVEKNETAISMVKILGYENREIASLYLHSTTLVVLIGTAVCTVLGTMIMSVLWRAMMLGYSGWFVFLMEPVNYIQIYVFIIIGYLLVLLIDYRRIGKIPMDEALKNVE